MQLAFDPTKLKKHKIKIHSQIRLENKTERIKPLCG